MLGPAGVWYGSEYHGIGAYGDLTGERVREIAERHWLAPEQYLAILMNDARYGILRLQNTAMIDVNDVISGSIYLCDLQGSDDQIQDWVLLEEAPVVIRRFGHMQMQRWGNSTLEKRRYTLLTGAGMAIVHYLTITREQKKIVKLKASVNDVSRAAEQLEGTFKAEKKKVASSFRAALSRMKKSKT